MTSKLQQKFPFPLRTGFAQVFMKPAGHLFLRPWNVKSCISFPPKEQPWTKTLFLKKLWSGSSKSSSQAGLDLGLHYSLVGTAFDNFRKTLDKSFERESLTTATRSPSISTYVSTHHWYQVTSAYYSKNPFNQFHKKSLCSLSLFFIIVHPWALIPSPFPCLYVPICSCYFWNWAQFSAEVPFLLFQQFVHIICFYH